MNPIIYPTLDLFLYDLRHGLGENDENIKQYRNNFQAQLPQDTSWKIDTNFECEFSPLLQEEGTQPFIKTFDDPETCEYEGFYYPVRLNDTYGLLLDASVKDSIKPYDINSFNDLKDYLKKKLKYPDPTIGKTWMLSGELSKITNDPEEIAKQCYKKLIPNGDVDRDLKGKGTFLGGYIFEFWRYELRMEETREEDRDKENKHKPTIQQIQSNDHVIIALYPNACAAKKASDYVFQEWMRLFSYRAKIMWAYGQSRYLKRRLQEKFVKIEEQLKNVKKAIETRPSIKEIQKTLATVSRLQSAYEFDLIDFQFQFKTIEVNLANYKKRLKLICEKAESTKNPLILPSDLSWMNYDTDLKVLENFSELVQDKYLQQVQKEDENILLGKQLLEGLMNSIEYLRILVETDQAQRDRTFQNSVAIWGIGLAAGSIVASISAQFPIVVVPTVAANQENDATKHPLSPYLSELGIKDPWLTPAISTTMSLGSTLIFALIIWGIIKLWERLFEKRRSNKT